ncbi:hypothetical protein ASF59_03545 [Methylobacterium sp. Leaf121]|nr:hypothetical protein ASF59_03545 [Methylobacterium sp. Leaf121]
MARASGHLKPAGFFPVACEVLMTDRLKSTSTTEAKGSVKEAIGKLTGDARVEAEGKAQKRQVQRSKAAPRSK